VVGTTKSEVEQFLKEFKRVWDGKVIARFNEKNDETLTILGITPNQRADEIRKLTHKNYFRGPAPDHSGTSGDIWEFGKKINKYELYIKLKIYEISGKKRGKCISFHIAERPINYPYQEKGYKNV
jgi:hypothetical protein